MYLRSELRASSSSRNAGPFRRPNSETKNSTPKDRYRGCSSAFQPKMRAHKTTTIWTVAATR